MDELSKKQLIEIWDEHIKANHFVTDNNGHLVNNIDNSRLEAIEVIKVIIRDFINEDITIYEFKAALDIFNRHNNLWNFSAKMGQMYFNQLLKSNEQGIDKLAALLKTVIAEPKDLKDAFKKIEELEKFTNAIFLVAEDKRKVPYPGSVGYFLSYFWQVHNPSKWPILYSSLINGFREIGIWKDQTSQKANYDFFYNLNAEIKDVLKEHSKKDISNWDVEHTFWNFKYSNIINPNIPVEAEEAPVMNSVKAPSPVEKTFVEEVILPKAEPVKPIEAVNQVVQFDVYDYLIPKVARLFEFSQADTKLDKALFEPTVAEAFKQLDFEITILPQGVRKNPYCLVKFREENLAFIVDTKLDSGTYFNTTDDRALKEAINDHCSDLKREGYKKVGFMLVCSAFESNHSEFINYISWNTDIKKMMFLTSDALLYLLAFKIKDKIRLSSLIERLVSLSILVTPQSVINEFESSL